MDELVAQFCAITAADSDTANRYLVVADQDLETAVTLFLEGGGASIASQEDAVTRTSSGNISGGGSEDEDEALSRRLQQEEYNGNNSASGEVREAIRPVRETLVQPGFNPFGSADFLQRSVGHGGRRQQAAGIFNQFAEPQQRYIGRPLNAFGDVSSGSGGSGADDDEDEHMSDGDLSGSMRFRQRTEETTGLTNMTPAQSRLARIFQPPFDLIRNMDLDMVCYFFNATLILTKTRPKTMQELTVSGFSSTSKMSASSNVSC